MSAPRRPPRRVVDGVLLLDKPLGITSNTALQIARRLYNAAKGGHTGTLDPLATGLLPLCFGNATKFAGELLDADKAYDATLRLGIRTDTADAEGQILETLPVNVSDAQIDAAIAQFIGDIEQIPPMHSALKRDGKPLYAYAREGIELERQPRPVTITAITHRGREGDLLHISVDCSKGTYIRTLAEDIGRVLGCGAHLAALRRTRIGRITLDSTVTLAAVEALELAERDALLLPTDALLKESPRADLSETDSLRVSQGQAIRWQGEAGTRYRAYAATGVFLGLCELNADGLLQPKRLVSV